MLLLRVLGLLRLPKACTILSREWWFLTASRYDSLQSIGVHAAPCAREEGHLDRGCVASLKL